MRKLILISAIILVNSCATTAPIPVTLNCPPELELPTLTEYQATDLQKLGNDTYMVLVARDRMMAQRIVTLCAIIESTH